VSSGLPFFSSLFFIQHCAFNSPKAACWLDRRLDENGPIKSSSQFGRRSQTARSEPTQQNFSACGEIQFRPAAYTPIRARQSLTAH
jgi:hypothetical protein